MKVFLLWHIHELADDFGTHDEEMLIGVFSSSKIANDTIQKFKNLDGFRDYSLDCFMIEEYELDKPTNWTEGFCTVRWTE